MNIILKSLLTFLVITVVTTLAMKFSDIQFMADNFWDHHGIFFLIFISIFPRLTLLFSSVPFGGLFWWLGFFFAPRFLVAILATLTYWEENPILVVISWLVALSGESGEKVIISNRVKTVRSGKSVFHRGDTIEAEYKEI